MKIAVIGAGAAGLVAIKYCVQEGYECEAFEQTEFVGGTWNYTDEVGLDKNGLPVHTSMYKNLRTNLPKEVMMFENFPYREDIEESYITQSQVLEYLNDYADKLKLRKHIRHLKLVTHIEPVESNKWDIDIQDVKTKYTEKKRFDAVIVCNGKYGVPYIPKILGLETFPGSCIHSHDYRSEEPYKDKVVLVIGGGPSGIDIAHRLYQVAKKVFCSFKEIGFRFNFPAGLIRKPLVERINGNTVFFQDESKEEIDAILLCTGFNISYPFLSTKCGIVVEDNYVKNVYKEVINISYPTMAILGIPSAICPFPTAEIQVVFSFKTSPFAAFFPSGPIQKSMEKIEQSVVCFEDGSKEQVDDIILCTGYLYSFPFLSNKCKIVVDDNYIKGLFKECLCIEYPTLMFLGLPGQVCPIPTSEVQMRFFMSLMKGNFRLPCKEDMWEEDNYRRQAKNCTNRQFHKKGAKNERIYWDELAMTASVNTVPYVITKLHEWIVSNKRNITQSFRIVNDEEFERIA